MGVTLGHLFLFIAVADLVLIWSMTSKWRSEDDRKPEAERRPAGLMRATVVALSIGLVAFALLHPLGDLPLF